MTDHEVLVIGAGSAGLTVALSSAEIGLDTAIIDKDKESFGGECLNSGCVPSKALLHIAKQIHNASKTEAFGYELRGKTDWEAVKKAIRRKQETIRSHESPEALQKNGVSTYVGEARFVGRKTIQVGQATVSAKNIVLCTGTRPRIPDIPGLPNTDYHTNESIFNLAELPEELLVIGGGPIGVELGQAFNRLGSNVTIIERNRSILAREESLASQYLAEQLRSEDIQIHLKTQVKHVENGTAKIEVDGKDKQVNFDALLIATGRTANTEHLGLEKANVDTIRNGFIEHKTYQTSNPNIFVCGDAAGPPFLSHKAERDASIIVENFFRPLFKKQPEPYVPSVTYTDPEIASFGAGRRELEKQGIEFNIEVTNFSEVDRAVTDGYEDAFVALYTHKKKLLGGVVVAPNAGELITGFSYQRSENTSFRAELRRITPYPTASMIQKSAALNHVRKHTPKYIKTFLQTLYAWRY